MMRINRKIITAAAFLLILSSCVTNRHIVGKGAQGDDKITDMQWYVLWGAVPLNEPDTKKMAEGAQDYEIKSEFSAVNMLINIFTMSVSLVSRSVTVKK